MLSVEEFSKIIDGHYNFDKNYRIKSISSLEKIRKDSLVFIFDKKNLLKIKKNKDFVLVIQENLNHELHEFEKIFVVKNIKEAFVKSLNFFQKKTSAPSSNFDKSKYPLVEFSSTCYLGFNVEIGINSSIGLNVIIEDDVSLGKNVQIGHGCVIHAGTKISDNVIIQSGTIIGSNGFGNIRNENKKWINIPHIGYVEIHRNVSIGAGCSIDRGTIDNTVINSGVQIDNQVHIAHNVIIGKDSAIAANVGIAGSTVIGQRNLIGGMVGIIDHLKLCDDVIISAKSIVIHDINEPGIYSGIMPITKHHNWKRIALWITKLDKISKFLKIKRNDL